MTEELDLYWDLNLIEDLPMIKTWSYSRMSDFERCRFLAKLKYVDKIPEPSRPLKPGQLEHANDRGTRIHESAELYVKDSNIALIPELKKFQTEFEELRIMFNDGKVILEQEWAVDKDWMPVAWASDTAWNRAKLDAFIHVDEENGRAIDYKTGKKFGNEVKHAEQLQLYQLLSFMRFPKLQSITVELWYIDQGPEHTTKMTFTREQGLRFFKNFNARGIAVTSCENFSPNPNSFSCKWCAYGPKGTGHCAVGV